jgi:hypothetical protein
MLIQILFGKFTHACFIQIALETMQSFHPQGIYITKFTNTLWMKRFYRQCNLVSDQIYQPKSL